jgi:hypothetical protein
MLIHPSIILVVKLPLSRLMRVVVAVVVVVADGIEAACLAAAKGKWVVMVVVSQ